MPDDCILWARSTKNGYGQWKSGRYVHRDVYEAVKGPIPKGFLVRHTCDVRLCVNPDHLVLGTKRDNILDVRDREPGKWERICWGGPHKKRRT